MQHTYPNPCARRADASPPSPMDAPDALATSSVRRPPGQHYFPTFRNLSRRYGRTWRDGRGSRLVYGLDLGPCGAALCLKWVIRVPEPTRAYFNHHRSVIKPYRAVPVQANSLFTTTTITTTTAVPSTVSHYHAPLPHNPSHITIQWNTPPLPTPPPPPRRPPKRAHSGWPARRSPLTRMRSMALVTTVPGTARVHTMINRLGFPR